MNVIPALVLSLALLAACRNDESVAAYAPAGAYVLTEINGAAFLPAATIDVSEPGRVFGQAPCNSWSATQTAPYPWFETGPIAATRMACSDLDAEAAFFAALEAMTLAEAVGETLILSNTNGGEMVFEAVR